MSQNLLRVVIAEDEALIRLDLKEMLEEEGYSVVAEVGDGESAVERVTALRPDLAILDVKMPILDGISAAERIAAERLAPVVILTAFSQRELVERARDAGRDGLPGQAVHQGRPGTRGRDGGQPVRRDPRARRWRSARCASGWRSASCSTGPRACSSREHGLSEPEAFRWIQKTSMDRRLTMRKVAEAVIEGSMAGPRRDQPSS